MEQPPRENEAGHAEENINRNAPDYSQKLEREPSPMARVFIVRHGATEYKEYFDPNHSEITNDLTEEGKKEIEDASVRLESLVDKNKPVRIISSPRIRTQNSAEIIKDEFIKRHLNVKPAEVKTTETFQGVKTFTDAAELWTELVEKYESEGKNFDTEWRAGRVRGDARLESDVQIQERLKESFIKGIRILRRSQDDSRDLSQTILVTNGEAVSAILAAFGQRPFLDTERKIQTGSISTINVFEDRVKIEAGGFTYEINI